MDLFVIKPENAKKLAEFIKLIRAEKKLTRGQIQYKSGIKESDIFRFENATKKRINAIQLKALANALEIDAIQLFKLAGFLDDNDINLHVSEKVKNHMADHVEMLSGSDNVKVPVFNSVSAGLGRIPGAEPIDYLSLPVSNGHEYVACKVHGDSMTPAIADNAILLIAKNCQISNGDVGVFIVNDEAYVKRYMKKDKFVFLISDNTHYDPIIVSESDDFQICGKAVRTVNEL